MQCVQHKTNNMVLRGDHIENCYDVTATLVFDTPTDTRILTYWQPSEQDIANILAGHLVCLSVFGRAHPPVAITVEAP